MEIVYLVIGLMLLLVILGDLLFLAAQFLVHKMGEDLPERRKHLWVWRSFLFVTVAYLVGVVFANKELVFMMFPGNLGIIPIIIMTIFFVSIIEIVIIDLLLPDLVPMWKRVTIEVLGFIMLCLVSFYTFNAGLQVLSTLI